MNSSPVAARYAEALFSSAKAAGEIDQTLEPLNVLGDLMKGEARLREFFLNPDVDPEDKVGMLDRVTQKSWSPLVRAFMQMLTAVYRAELLLDIVEAFRVLVDVEHKRVYAVIRSARKLAPDSLARLKALLERREGRTVLLREELDPSLLGGLQVMVENRVIDGSVKRRLSDLRAQLRQVSVA